MHVRKDDMVQVMTGDDAEKGRARRAAFRVRTTTARTTSPGFTSPPGIAFLTLAIMTSPSPA